MRHPSASSSKTSTAQKLGSHTARSREAGAERREGEKRIFEQADAAQRHWWSTTQAVAWWCTSTGGSPRPRSTSVDDAALCQPRRRRWTPRGIAMKKTTLLADGDRPRGN